MRKLPEMEQNQSQQSPEVPAEQPKREDDKKEVYLYPKVVSIEEMLNLIYEQNNQILTALAERK